MSAVSDLLRYLRRPVFIQPRRGRLNLAAWVTLTKLWGLTLTLAITAVTISSGLYVLINGELPGAADGFEDLMQGPRFFWMAVVIAPLLEEALFRSWLGYKRGILLAMPILLCLSAILMILSRTAPLPAMTLPAVISILAALFIYLWRYQKTQALTDRHDNAALSIFPLAFWGSAGLFALMHIGNHAHDGFNITAILLVLPQFIIGTILGYVRMKYSLPVAIGFHGLYNSVFVALAAFA